MAEQPRLAWERCQFAGDALLLEEPDVHDNFVYALSVDLERHLLTLHTQYRDGAGPYDLTDVRFVGVVAHHFDDLVAPSILLDIEEGPVETVLHQRRDLFERGKTRGWPLADCLDLVELLRVLTERGVLGYWVMGSCGLDGFVLATGVEYCRRERPAEVG